MKTETAPVAKTNGVGRNPRLKDQETEVVSARIPKEQAAWLLEEARRGFRGRGDMLALLIEHAYLQSKEIGS